MCRSTVLLSLLLSNACFAIAISVVCMLQTPNSRQNKAPTLLWGLPEVAHRGCGPLGPALSGTVRQCPIFRRFHDADSRERSPTFAQVGIRVGISSVPSCRI